MSIYLGQLPPAEIARLKAELAETLIAHFCYPRFYDYRTNSLRSRPVDRAKRQEVWLYLSSVDFTAWSRVDLLSPEFQHQIERLFIHFVQRNRNFFGEQGRKRMSDIRMLITTSATSVVQGIRGHLTGQRQNNPPFGSPRPVLSWTTTNATGRIEQSWDQIAPSALLLQHQLQEVRGEPLTGLQGEPRSPGVPKQTVTPALPAQPNAQPPQVAPRPTNGSHTNGSHTNGSRGDVLPPLPKSPITEVYRNTSHPGSSLAGSPVPASTSAPATSGRNPEITIATVETPAVKAPAIARMPEPPVAKVAAPERVQPIPSVPPTPQTVVRQAAPSPSPAGSHSHVASPPASQVSQAPQVFTGSRETAPAPVSGEDVAIFEQMRHQLIVWLRIEAVRSGKDISGQGPSQLLDLLHQQENYDETRLQVVSTLLNLSNQVIKNGQASLLDYKQALMFHLIHTTR